MKKLLKTTLCTLVIALVTTLTMNVYAYSGTMDANDNIKIGSVSNGTGSVEITPDVSAGYKLYYQWVEIDDNTYNQIQKINDEVEVITYYNLYEAYTSQGITNTEFGTKYENAQKSFKAKYGSIVEDFSTKHSAELKALKINLFPNYDEAKWTQTTDNTFKMNLATFTGTKNYTAWIKLVTKSGTTAYDAEAFKLVGTKQETGTTIPDNNNQNNNNTNTNNNNQNNNNNSNTDNNNQNNNNNSNTNNNNQNNNNNNNNTNNNNQNNNNNNNNNTNNNNQNNNNNNTNTNNNNQNNNNNNNNTNNNNQNNNNNANTNNNSQNNNNNNNTNKDDGKKEPVKNNTNNSKNDGTTSNTKLPQTGVSYGIVVAMLFVAGFAVVEFIKYKKIK